MKTIKIKQKAFMVLIAGIIISTQLYAQNQVEMRIMEDNITDFDGLGLPGVNIVIKGTDQGTVTDIEGYYQIEAPLGSRLVISYVGFLTQEMLVTRENSKPAHRYVTGHLAQITNLNPLSRQSSMDSRPSIPDFFVETNENETKPDSASEVKSVANSQTSYVLTQNNWPMYNKQYMNIDPSKITNIGVFKNDEYHSNMFRYNQHNILETKAISYNSPVYKYVPHIAFLQTFNVETALMLPKLQDQYAQGIFANGEATWTHPGLGNDLSWGPNLNHLEYDGNANHFSKLGNFTSLGNGTGKVADFFDPLSFFNTGKTEITSVSVYAKVKDKYRYKINFQNKRQEGIIPMSLNNTTNLGGEFEWYKTVQTKFGLKYSNHNDKLNLEGPSLSRLLKSVYVTPVSFDNLNDQKKNTVPTDKSVYLLPDGSQRSAAPGVLDNPYYLLMNSHDKSKSNRVNSYLKLEKDFFVFLNASGQLSHDVQSSTETMGFPALDPTHGPSMYFARKTHMQHTSTNLYITIDRRHQKLKYTLIAGSQFDTKSLNIKQFEDNAYVKNTEDKTDPVNSLSLKRNTLDSKIQSNLNYDEIYVFDAKYSFHYSSTLGKTYTAPALSAAINVTEYDFARHEGFISLFKARSSWGIFYNEPSMHQPFGKFSSLTTAALHFENTCPDRFITFNNKIDPEKSTKRNLGFDLNLFYNKLNFAVDMYKNTVHDFLVPEILPDNIQFKNAGIIENTGWEFSVTSYIFNNGLHQLQTSLNISGYNSLVKEVYGENKMIPIGGFQDVYTAMIEGETTGAIVGSYYQRNSLDQLVVDNEGYPMVANNLKIIGDPTPDYLAGFSVNYKLHGFTLQCLLEIKKGGDIWNGTRNTLSYYGVSEESAAKRQVSDYIFPGTYEDGRVNNTTVDFANPQNGMAQNSWYRYGETGVAEDAIEDGSWMRMKNIEVSYSIPTYWIRDLHLSTVKFSTFSKNLFIISRYKGVDPESTLWGQENNVGLDFFNMPTTRTLGLKVSIVF